MQRGEFRVDYRGRGEISGLSGTVSRVINNHPYVSDEKKKGSISNEAFRLRSNSAARRLRKQKRKQLRC